MLQILVHSHQQSQLCSENNARAGTADLSGLAPWGSTNTSSAVRLFPASISPQSELS